MNLRQTFRGIKCWVVTHKLHAAFLFLLIQVLLTLWIGDLIVNWSFYLRFIITVNILTVYTFFLFVKQVRETKANKDVYSPLRNYILAILVLSIITLCPLVMYQYLIATGNDSVALRNMISIIGGLNQITTTVLMVLIFTYRVKVDGE